MYAIRSYYVFFGLVGRIVGGDFTGGFFRITSYNVCYTKLLRKSFNLLRQTAKHEKVIDNLKQLLMITDVLLMDKEVVSNALNSGLTIYSKNSLIYQNQQNCFMQYFYIYTALCHKTS